MVSLLVLIWIFLITSEAEYFLFCYEIFRICSVTASLHTMPIFQLGWSFLFYWHVKVFLIYSGYWPLVNLCATNLFSWCVVYLSILFLFSFVISNFFKWNQIYGLFLILWSVCFWASFKTSFPNWRLWTYQISHFYLLLSFSIQIYWVAIIYNADFL